MQIERHYGMDWLRIGAFALLILYHVGMVFVPWGYHVKAEHQSIWVGVPMLATNAWRMGLLFVVSGYATAMLLARQDGGMARFLAGRTARLLPPLLFGMAVIVPPQTWVELTTQHGYSRGYLTFWPGDYFTAGEIDGVVVPTWNHLWFLVYLLAYTLLLALLLQLPQAWRAALERLAERALAGPFVLIVPLGLLWIRLALQWPAPPETHDLFGDFHAHQAYFALFLFGFLLAGSDVLWTAIRRWWRVAAVLAVAGYAAVLAVGVGWLGMSDPPLWSEVLFAGAREVQAWGAIVALVGLADRFWNRDHRWRAMLNEAIFPFYLVHQTIIVVAAYGLIGHGIPGPVQFAALVGATAGGCWAFYAAGRRIAPLRPLIGLRFRRGASTRAVLEGREHGTQAVG